MLKTKNFAIELDRVQKVVAWKFTGLMNLEEVIDSVKAIKDAITTLKRQSKGIRILVDNWVTSQDGVLAYSQEIMQHWIDLQKWFVQNLSDDDKIGVIQGSATMKMQMSRFSRDIGLSKIEKHCFVKDYETTKKEAYEYLGISSNRLIDSK